MNFTLVNSLILAGVIQGFVFGIIYLVSKKYKSKSTLFLTLLIIMFSYNNLQFYLQDADVLRGLSMYRTLYIPVGSLIPVFLYFYTLEFTVGLDNHFKKSKRLLFFLPFLLFFINTIFFKIYSTVTPLTRSVYTYFKSTQDFQSIFSFVYTLVLIALCYKHIIAYRKELKTKNARSFYQYTWFKKALVLLFFLSLFWGVTLFIYLTRGNYTLFFNLLWIGLSITIYYIGHIGIYKYGVAEERKKIRIQSNSIQDLHTEENRNKKTIVLLQEQLIDKQRFLEPMLTLESLANDIGVSKSYLSRIFNTELNKSFPDYVNQLRVDKAKTYLSNAKFSKYTLVAIGLEAGFNSKTTFNTAFKKFTGTTPSQYRKSSHV